MKPVIFLYLFLFVDSLFAQQPFIAFSDLISGPATGNSDHSQIGQVSNADGAIVTLWGMRLGSSQNGSKVIVGGKEARIYRWVNAIGPADLYTRLYMQMIEFQIPSTVTNGNVNIQVIIGKDTSNSIPFTIRPGKIYFVMKNGNDDSGDGSWDHPWKSLDNVSSTGALFKIHGGDIVYVGDGVTHTDLAGDRSAIDLSEPGETGRPKAIIAYPGARASIGDSILSKSYSMWVSGIGPSTHWVISKMNLTASHEAASMYHDFRLIGNKITAPKGDGPTGAIAALGNHLFILGNELTNIGNRSTSKLYHPMYLQSAESCSGPRLPIESDREVAWNYIHDNLAYDGINLYRECSSSAYMTHHRVHDNFILNQTGCGIRCGDYVVGENWFYNNVIIQAGIGPDPLTEQAMHMPILIHAGWDDTTTLIHFYNNTIYGGGYPDGAEWSYAMIGFAYPHPFNLDFRNNIIVSTDARVGYYNSRFSAPTKGSMNNVWWGSGDKPTWDIDAYSYDPSFSIPDKNDLHLSPFSQCIDAGLSGFNNSILVPERDINGYRRAGNGKKIDIGAYEYIKSFPVPMHEETKPGSSTRVFPNPAKNYATIMSKDITDHDVFFLFDITGRLIRQSKLNNMRFDLTGIGEGSYVLKGEKIVIKLMVVK